MDTKEIHFITMYHEIHRLRDVEHFSIQRIADHLSINFRTVKTYLDMSLEDFEHYLESKSRRSYLLDPYREFISGYLSKYEDAPASVVHDRLKKELREKSNNKEPMVLLDVRNPDEYEEMRLGVGEKLIPLGQLRKRLNELPEDKNTEIITWCKISLRGYEAARVLQAYGYRNVKVLKFRTSERAENKGEKRDKKRKKAAYFV
jgi:rhodanese-related sulfurtransferase